jgi:hypothetical protein
MSTEFLDKLPDRLVLQKLLQLYSMLQINLLLSSTLSGWLQVSSMFMR